jgi:ABC-type lipoprotein export system ATPase subunit
MSALIALENVVKVHAAGSAAEVRALDGISFEIQRGEYVAIVGESGSGKTTLMHLLGALDRATSGSLTVAGHDLSRASRRDLQRFRAHEVGFVFQGFNLVPALDALANVELAAHYARRTPAEGRRAALALLAEVGLAERVRHRPSQLSGGQQQRVAIARALVNEPALLLADEPTGELDTKTAAGVLELLERLNAERGQTIVMVTHNPAVWKRASRVIELSDGRLA